VRQACLERPLSFAGRTGLIDGDEGGDQPATLPRRRPAPPPPTQEPEPDHQNRLPSNDSGFLSTVSDSARRATVAECESTF